MRLLLGTSNPAKLARYRAIVASVATKCPELGIEISSLQDVSCTLGVAEDGDTAQENARKKAVAYARATNLPTLSVDEALHIAGLADEDQPGPYVRRFRGQQRTDEELLAAFVDLVRGLRPGERTAVWTFALCLALPLGAIYEQQVLIPTILSDVIHRPLLPGYPLRSLSLDPATSKPLAVLTNEEEQVRLQPLHTAVGAILDGALPQLLAEWDRARGVRASCSKNTNTP